MISNKLSILLSSFILLLFFAISIGYNSNYEIENFCKAENLDCLLSLAIETNNVNYCKKSTNSNLCYEELSIELKNPLLCDNLQNSQNCYLKNSVITNNLKYCNKTQDEDECIFQVASNNLNPDLCEQSQDSEFCYYSYALDYGDKIYCQKSGQYGQVCTKELE